MVNSQLSTWLKNQIVRVTLVLFFFFSKILFSHKDEWLFLLLKYNGSPSRPTSRGCKKTFKVSCQLSQTQMLTQLMEIQIKLFARTHDYKEEGGRPRELHRPEVFWQLAGNISMFLLLAPILEIRSLPFTFPAFNHLIHKTTPLGITIAKN